MVAHYTLCYSLRHVKNDSLELLLSVKSRAPLDSRVKSSFL